MFPKIQNISEKQENIIYDSFKQTLKIEPEKRCDLNYLVNIFNDF